MKIKIEKRQMNECQIKLRSAQATKNWTRANEISFFTQASSWFFFSKSKWIKKKPPSVIKEKDVFLDHN